MPRNRATTKKTPAKTPAPPFKNPKNVTSPEKIPKRILAPTLDDHLAVMSRAIFQAGLSWAFIESHWSAFLAAFDRFSIARVAAYGEADLERLMETEGIVHSRSKIEATFHNARVLRDLAQAYGSIEAYLASFPDHDARFADARKRFAFLGELSAYYWLFRTGAPVPPFETWIARQEKDHPRVREMVMAGRADETSTEVA